MIARQDGYILRKIEDSWYLLPYGQRVADLRRGICLNETGADIWNLLDHPRLREKIFPALAEKYNVGTEEYPDLVNDVNAFVEQLLGMGFLRETEPSVTQPLYRILEIAGLKIGLYGEAQWFPGEWDLFAAKEKNVPEEDRVTETIQNCDNGREPEIIRQNGSASQRMCMDQQIELIPYRHLNRQTGTVLLLNHELNLYQTEDGYMLEFPTMENIKKVEISRDGRQVRMYILPGDKQEYRENIFHAVRHCFLYLAQKKGKHAIHSASLLYRGKAWLFSGHSGAGKSTHTNLWKEQFETPVLNGDLNLVGEKDGNLLVYGIPWCGTSGICTKETYPLGGIVLLAQDAQNRLETLTQAEKTLRVMQRMISPVWLPEQLDQNLKFAGRIAAQIPVCSYRCTKEPEAAVYLKETFVDIEKRNLMTD